MSNGITDSLTPADINTARNRIQLLARLPPHSPLAPQKGKTRGLRVPIVKLSGTRLKLKAPMTRMARVPQSIMVFFKDYLRDTRLATSSHSMI